MVERKWYLMLSIFLITAMVCADELDDMLKEDITRDTQYIMFTVTTTNGKARFVGDRKDDISLACFRVFYTNHLRLREQLKSEVTATLLSLAAYQYMESYNEPYTLT